MTAALVQDGDSNGGAPAVTSGAAATVLPGNSTIGHCVAICIDIGSTTATVSSVTSPIGIFVFVGRLNNAGLDSMEQWVCLTATGAANTVTVTTSTGSPYRVQATEWTGVVSAAAGGSSTATSSTAAQTVTPAETGDAVVVQAGIDVSSGQTFSTRPTSPWTSYNAGDYTSQRSVAWQVTASNANVTATWSLSGSAAWGALGLILKTTPSTGDLLAFT